MFWVKVKGKVFYGLEPTSGESSTTESGVNSQLLAVITETGKQPNEELLAAVDHNHLQTMASEKVDLIDWWRVAPLTMIGSIP